MGYIRWNESTILVTNNISVKGKGKKFESNQPSFYIDFGL